MSVKVSAYVPILNDELVPKICDRFAECGMRLAFGPHFSLDRVTNSGVIVMRLSLMDGPGTARYHAVDLFSEFDLTIKNFKYNSPLSVDPAINLKLKSCTNVVQVRMHANHTSSLRTGLFFAAFLAEITDGIVYAPRSDAYLAPHEAIAQFREEVETYEANLPDKDWRIVPFDSWPPGI
jgi:hypothetical protein